MATILIIDDDAEVRDVLSAVIEQAGHAVIAAENGPAGLQKFADERPDRVVTDIIMPEMDGLEIIASIRLIDPHARVAAISGGGLMVDASYCMKTASSFGAFAVMQKPFKIDEVVETVRRCLCR